MSGSGRRGLEARGGIQEGALGPGDNERGGRVAELETELKETTREFERKLNELRSNQDVIAEQLRNERAREQFMLRQNEKIRELARELAEIRAWLQRREARGK